MKKEETERLRAVKQTKNRQHREVVRESGEKEKKTQDEGAEPSEKEERRAMKKERGAMKEGGV